MANEDDEELSKQINEEYKIWKKNTPFLYHHLYTHVLEWPSLTVEWLPDLVQPPAGIDQLIGQKMILGTHASENERNYLIIVEVVLLSQDAQIPISFYDSSNLSSFANRTATPKVRPIVYINHDGEVNRARYMPQNSSVIATKTVSGDVCVFDSSKRPYKIEGTESSPDLRLRGHNSEGFGLSWSNLKVGYVLSGASDSQICLWDTSATPTNKALDAYRTFKVNDDGGVEDVAWNMRNEYLFGSVGEDKYLHIWDLRNSSVSNPAQSVLAHEEEVNCLAFNPSNEWTLVSGSSDTTVKFFDRRKIDSALHTFDVHEGKVFQVGWSPKNESVFASSCTGRRVLLWDISRIGEEQKPEVAVDGPPELLFVHAGHTSGISDFSWNPREDWMMASVAEDNILQIWQIPDNIYIDNDDDYLPQDSLGQKELLK